MIATRLRKLESRVQRTTSEFSMELSDLEWLRIFTDLESTGIGKLEPDYAQTLAAYRVALADAQHIATEIDPQHDFNPRHPRRVPTLQMSA